MVSSWVTTIVILEMSGIWISTLFRLCKLFRQKSSGIQIIRCLVFWFPLYRTHNNNERVHILNSRLVFKFNLAICLLLQTRHVDASSNSDHGSHLAHRRHGPTNDSLHLSCHRQSGNLMSIETELLLKAPKHYVGYRLDRLVETIRKSQWVMLIKCWMFPRAK